MSYWYRLILQYRYWYDKSASKIGINDLGNNYVAKEVEGYLQEITERVASQKSDIGTVTLNTTSKNIKGAINEINTNKVSKPTNASTGNVAKFDANRNIIDSGYTIEKSVPYNAIFTDTIYVHPNTAGNKHIPAGGVAGQVLKNSGDGIIEWGESAKSVKGAYVGDGTAGHRIISLGFTPTFAIVEDSTMGYTMFLFGGYCKIISSSGGLNSCSDIKITTNGFDIEGSTRNKSGYLYSYIAIG